MPIDHKYEGDDTESENGGLIIATRNGINFYRLCALKSALRLEVLGMKRRGMSVYRIVRNEFGFVGNKAEVLAQLIAHIDAIKVDQAQKDYADRV